MIPGDTIRATVARQTAGGAAPGGAYVLADFDITAILAGVDYSGSVAPAVTYIGPDQTGTRSLYAVALTLPATTGFMQVWIDPAAGTDVIENGFLSGEIMAYDEDSLAALSLLSQGQPAVLSAADSVLGDIIDGDSYLSPVLTMPSGKLSPFGITDISAGGITVEAAICASPGATSYPITVAIVNGAALTYTIGWNTQQHPALPTGQGSASWYIDIQVIRAASMTPPPYKVIVTTGRYQFTQQWQRDTRTT